MQALDFEASRATAPRPELGEYRIVHFATHGSPNKGFREKFREKLLHNVSQLSDPCR